MKKLIVVAGFTAALFVGCMTQEDYREQRAERAAAHFERARDESPTGGRVVTLDEAVKLAVANNLDIKVMKLEEQVAEEAKTAELLGMLPELNVSVSGTSRNNDPASSSRQINGQNGYGTYSYSQSQEKDSTYVNADLALSVLDFGLAYFNTAQAKDRELMRKVRTERTRQNVVLQTVGCYFTVAAAQRAVRETKDLLASCTNRYELIDKMAKNGKIGPFRAFDETKKFTEMEKRLTNFTRHYDNSKSELRALLGLYPNTEICVDDAILDKVPAYDLPDMETMEQISLMRRPELWEIDMQEHINVVECRKTILAMFPNVRIFYDYTHSDNDFLYKKSWMELGFRAAYNLLKLPQQVYRYKGYAAQVDAEKERAYAQAIAIMSQVRIAHSNILSMKDRLAIDTRINDSYRENLRKATEGQKVSGEVSNLELAHMRLSTVETTIERMVTLGNYYVSYFKLLNALGIDDLSNETVNAAINELGAARARTNAKK